MDNNGEVRDFWGNAAEKGRVPLSASRREGFTALLDIVLCNQS